LAVLVVVLGLGGGAAGAKKKKGTPRASRITLTHPSSTQFSGFVRSKLKGCRSSRIVILFYTDPNNGLTSPLSVQRTDGKGRYRVTLATPAYAGTYQARVQQRKIRVRKALQVCKKAKSPTISI
jgi:hypothetical protein